MHMHIFLWCLHTSKRKQASKFLGFRVVGGKSRASCIHTMIEEKCARTDLFTKQGPAKSVSQCHSRIQPTKQTHKCRRIYGDNSSCWWRYKGQGFTMHQCGLVLNWEYVTKNRCLQLIHSTMVSMRLLWNLKVSNLFLQRWHFLLLWILRISTRTGQFL